MDKQLWQTALRLDVKPKVASSSLKEDQVIFQLLEQTRGVVLQTIDKKGDPVLPNYQLFTGYERQLLSTLENLREKQDFVIDWENPVHEIYLSEHPYLLTLLEQCEHVVGQDGKPLTFVVDPARIFLQLEATADEQITASHYVQYHDQRITDFSLVTEQAILANSHIYRIPPLGDGFANLPLFNSTLTKENLCFFLSLYYSYISGVLLQYSGFQLHLSEEIIEAEPCLVFEKVDTDKSLYLSVGQTLNGISAEQMQNYRIHRYAQINHLEEKIRLRPVQQLRYESLITTIDKLLKGKGRSKSTAYFNEDNRFIIDEELAAQFVTMHLPRLLQDFRVLGAEQLREYKIVARPPQLKMNLSHGIDFLEGDVKVEIDEFSIDLLEVLRQYRKQKYVLLADGNKAILDDQYVRKLERIFKPKSKSKKVELSIFDLPLAEELISDSTLDSPFKRSRAVFDGFNKLAEDKTRPPKLNAKLRPYQTYGFKWLNYLREQKLNGCLADDMGLGKTIQAISILALVYKKKKAKPSIVVCPRSLLQNWYKECKKFAPALKTHIHYGIDRNWKKAKGAQVFIMTYAVMRNDIEELKEKDLAYVILDESQNIKNIQAQTTRAALLLKADHRLALSGTPIENNLGELYSLFRFLNPGMFGTFRQFVTDYATPIQKHNDPEATAQLRKKIFPFILRRRKQDVLEDLPDKVEQTLYVDMSEAQQKLYETRRMFYKELIEQQVASQGIAKSQFVVFQALNELRQIATIPESFSDGKIKSAKRELLLEQLAEVLANGRKALIFVNYLAALDLLGEELDELGVDYVSMSGSTRNRQSLVDRFQEDPNCRVFLMTLKTGGTGLNLTAASTVFIYDPWWNVAAELQAIDRTHRIGQVNKVHAIRLIASGSIEEKIRLLQEKKKALFDSVIGADSATAKKLSESDIDFILSK